MSKDEWPRLLHLDAEWQIPSRNGPRRISNTLKGVPQRKMSFCAKNTSGAASCAGRLKHVSLSGKLNCRRQSRAGVVQEPWGFTIIEVSLFLAISGLLLASILIVTSGVINRQRYTDSVRTTQSFFQQQMDQSFNGRNSREGNEVCNSGTISVGTQTPGTSNCIYLGKLVQFSSGSSVMNIYMVIGSEPVGDITALTEAELMSAYNPKIIDSIGATTFEIPWDATVSGAQRKPDGANFDSIALLRSPRTGAIMKYTFTRAGTATDLKPTTDDFNNTLNKVSNVCVQSLSLLTSTSAVVIGAESTKDAVDVAFDINASAEC